MALVGRSRFGDRHEREADFVHDDPAVDAALDWFTRLQADKTDAGLHARFEDWLKQDPRHGQEFRALKDMWGSKAFERAVAGLDTFGVAAKPEAGGDRRRRWPVKKLAAAAAILVAAGAWQGPSMILAWRADYITAPGEQSVVALPDGSRMIMNTDSAVTVDFEAGRRGVRLLKGEAFFDVVHDADHPFQVAGAYGEVEVKGTAFSVRTDNVETAVVLERGLVDVTCLCSAGGEAQLQPGQTVTASAEALSEIANVDAGRALAWRGGRVSFEDAPLGKVVAELARYYRGRVFVMSSRAARLVVSGNYRLDNIEGAFRSLADAAGVKMTRIPGGVIILR